MAEAFAFFKKRLGKYDDAKRQTVRETLENAVIGVFRIESGLEATQVFEYQNSRGIKATEFELVKAFLMHQVYLKSENANSADNNITEIQQTVTNIYRLFDDFLKHPERPQEVSTNIYRLFDDFLKPCQAAEDIVKQISNRLVANLFLLSTDLYWDYILVFIANDNFFLHFVGKARKNSYILWA